MKKKYYIPKIEEFCIGFTIEIQDISNAQWGIFNIKDENDLISCLEQDIEEYRVKYLDKEDLESLGFTCIYKDNYQWLTSKSYWVHLTCTRISNRCVLTIETSVEINSERTLVINSIGIKNKFELERLLKQLNIE